MTAIENPDRKSYSLSIRLIGLSGLKDLGISIAQDLLSPSLSTQLIVIHSLDRIETLHRVSRKASGSGDPSYSGFRMPYSLSK